MPKDDEQENKEESDEESDEEFVETKRRRISHHPGRWANDPNEDIITPEDVTDEMLQNVADYVSEKVYDSSSRGKFIQKIFM